MNENFDSDALDYLLNQMDSARRPAFEQELQRNEAARAALKHASDALAGFASEVAPAEPMGADQHRSTLGAIVAASRHDDPVHDSRPRRRSRLLWPLAAAILLALNLLDFERPFVTGPASRRPVGDGKSGRPDVAGSAAKLPASESSAGARTSLPAPDAIVRSDASAMKERGAELDRLRDRLAELQRTQDTLRNDYDQLIRRIAEQAVSERDLNRLTTMELVDPATFARGERKGLVGIGRGVLTEPGIVTPPNSGPPPAGTSSSLPVAPYAWSVFDEKEHRGYLNLYQLPTPPADQSLQVWIRPLDTAQYQHVAEVPQPLQGGSGSVQYTLPATMPAPVEVLITVEPRQVNHTAPTGPTVLRGP